MSISILIADDHPLFLRGIMTFLNEQNFKVVGEATDGGEALDLISELRPDLAILDYEMPVKSGLEVARQIKAAKLPTKVIFLTFHKDPLFLQLAKIEHVGGFISKEFEPADLLKCIEVVLDGGQYFGIGGQKAASLKEKDEKGDLLTRSEMKIAKYVADGLTTREIADTLSIAERTVDKHRSNIIKKLSLDKRPNALLIWAQKNKELIS
jgi:DNA-binding NarL/FixJ family response regulator